MKNYLFAVLILIFSFFLTSCATLSPDRYNTQKGAAIGAGAGALIGQAIGGNTEGTLIGMASGALLGALVGNSVDQDYQAAREGVPQAPIYSNCRKVRKQIWENGVLVKETVEEICDPSTPGVRYYSAPPPPTYYYGWWAWPFVPSVSLSFGTHHSHHRGWHHR